MIKGSARHSAHARRSADDSYPRLFRGTSVSLTGDDVAMIASSSAAPAHSPHASHRNRKQVIGRNRSRVLVVSMLIAQLVITACGDGGKGAHNAPTPPFTSQSTSVSVKPSTGLLASYESGRKVTFGFIDPTTAEFSKYATFNVGTSYNANVLLSPDLTKYAMNELILEQNKDNIYHAGWSDLSGHFTDVNATERIDKFGPNRTFGAIGFDGDGSFYYTAGTPSTKPTIYKLPAGQSSGSQAMPGTLSHDLGGTGGYQPKRDGAGRIIYLPFNCDISFIDKTTYVEAKGIQIYKASVADPNGEPDCDRDNMAKDNKTPLLPSTNRAGVFYPVGSPDGSKVYFLYEYNGDLFVVDSSGRTAPTEVGKVTGVNDSDVQLVRWVQ